MRNSRKAFELTRCYDLRGDQTDLIKATEETFPLFERFYQAPTQQNFYKILEHSHLWRSIGKPFSLFEIKARRKWGLLPTMSLKESRLLENTEKRLFYHESRLKPIDVDILWALFRASGENKYPLRVKGLISSKNQCLSTKEKARLTYMTHVTNGFLFDGEFMI